MFRTALRTATRQQFTSSRRFVSTNPPHLKSRSWKSSAFRWGLAGAGIYYYNTSPVFAEQPQNNLLNPDVDAIDSDNPTIDRLLESSKHKPKHASTLQYAIETGSEKAVELTQDNHAALRSQTPQSQDDVNEAPAAEGAQDLEEEAASEGAFNPETGEINWDCPCLGGMAYGPCGEEFRTAFSCFVYSTDEPKGMDCVEKFGAMQDCFRAHPEVYAGEIDDDTDGDMSEEREELRKEIEERKESVQQTQRQRSQDGEERQQNEKQDEKVEKQRKEKKNADEKGERKQRKSDRPPQQSAKTTSHTPEGYSADREVENGGQSRTLRKPKTKGVDADALPESESLVPKAAHDATDMSSGATHSIAR